jgi:hypothetical protein
MDTATWVRIQHADSTPATRRLAEPEYRSKPAIAAMELVRRHNAGNGCSVPPADVGCPVLELTVEQADRVFVFVHGTRDGISRLSSGRCTASSATGIDIPATLHYEFPAARFADPDWPTVYAIAVSDPQLAQQFDGLLQHLPDACGPTAGLRADHSVDQWLGKLDHLIAGNTEHAVWTARRIP